MRFVTISHKQGELTVSTDSIEYVRKVNSHTYQIMGGEPFPPKHKVADRWEARVRIFESLIATEKEIVDINLTEKQYTSLLNELKTCAHERKDKTND